MNVSGWNNIFFVMSTRNGEWRIVKLVLALMKKIVRRRGLATLSRRFYVGLAQVRDFCPAPIRLNCIITMTPHFTMKSHHAQRECNMRRTHIIYWMYSFLASAMNFTWDKLGIGALNLCFESGA